MTLLNRREVIRLFGLGASFGAISRQLGVDLVATQGARQVTFPQGAIIRTILEDIRPETVTSGAILFHEHISLSMEWMKKFQPGVYDHMKSYPTQDFDLMVAEMKAAKEDGISILVDAGHADQGRRVDFVRRLAQSSGLPLVVSGGYFLPISYPPEVSTKTEDELVEIMVADAKTERWGAMGEVGTNATISDLERKVFRALGKTQARTGLPIFTHTSGGRMAVEQLDILESTGATASHVAIGHMGNADISVQKAICQRGAFIGFDSLARNPERDKQAIPVIRQLIDAGYVDNLLFSSDVAHIEEMKSKNAAAWVKDNFTKPVDGFMPGGGYGMLVTVFLPKLRQAGVSEDIIRRIVLDNQRRFLAFVPRT